MRSWDPGKATIWFEGLKSSGDDSWISGRQREIFPERGDEALKEPDAAAALTDVTLCDTCPRRRGYARHLSKPRSSK